MPRDAERQSAVAGAHFGDVTAGHQRKRLDHSRQIAAFILGSRGAVNGQQACQTRKRHRKQTDRSGHVPILVSLARPAPGRRAFAWTNGGTSGIQAVYDLSKERAVMSVTPVGGLHHITAIAGPAQENLDFYAGVLGMRLVKKSVNQDDPGTYHLFYADGEGHPGTDLTFFPWSHMAPPRMGHGLSVEVSLTVPPDSLEFWSERLHAIRRAAGRD